MRTSLALIALGVLAAGYLLARDGGPEEPAQGRRTPDGESGVEDGRLAEPGTGLAARGVPAPTAADTPRAPLPPDDEAATDDDASAADDVPWTPERALQRALDAIEGASWEQLLDAAPHLALEDRARVDARLIEASRAHRITPHNADPTVVFYLWKTGRSRWQSMERLVLDGLAAGGAVGAWVVVALRANPPPDADWFAWVLREHELPAKVAARVKKHLAAGRDRGGGQNK